MTAAEFDGELRYWNCVRQRLVPAPKETVSAETFEAIARLGKTNSRVKGYHDIWMPSRRDEFDPAVPGTEIRATSSNVLRRDRRIRLLASMERFQAPLVIRANGAPS